MSMRAARGEVLDAARRRGSGSAGSCSGDAPRPPAGRPAGRTPGTSVGMWKTCSSPVRASSTGPSTCGMTSPARCTMTVSPTRRSLRWMSSSLCSVASLTITPPTSTGSSSANGLRRAGAPDVDADAEQLRRPRRRRELEGAGPARIAADAAELVLHRERVDLHHDAVDLVVQRRPVGLQARARLAHRLDAVVARGQRVDRQAALAQPARAPRSATAAHALDAADRVGPERRAGAGRWRPGPAGAASRPPSCAGS